MVFRARSDTGRKPRSVPRRDGATCTGSGGSYSAVGGISLSGGLHASPETIARSAGHGRPAFLMEMELPRPARARTSPPGDSTFPGDGALAQPRTPAGGDGLRGGGYRAHGK